LKVLFIKDLENIYVYEDGRVYKSTKKEKGINTSIIKYKNIYVYSFKLPGDIKEDELEMEVEKYLYNEEALDFSKDYKINFVFRKINNEYFIEAFVVEIDKLKSEFEKIVEKFKYIEFISPSFFVFSSYYDVKNEENYNDLFIYFDKEDSYVVCFSNKEFVFVKGLLKFALLEEEIGDDVLEILEKKGLNQDLYEDESLYNKVDEFFSQFFSRLNSIINYNLASYNLNKIDRIFFYSPFKINNLVEQYKEFWNLSGIEFKLLDIETDYDKFDYLATIFNAKNYKNEELNFSIFKKPPPIYKRESGKIALIAGGALLVLLADAGYKYYKINELDKQIKFYKEKYSKNKNLITSLKKKEKKLKKEIKEINSKIAELNLNIQKIDKAVSKINDDVCKHNFINEYSKVANFLDKYSLNVYYFEKKDNIFYLKIISDYDNSEKIALFLKDLVNIGFKNVSSSKIINIEDKYLSVVRFENE